MTNEQWQAAYDHCKTMHDEAIQLSHGYFYTAIRNALMQRYYNGERTQELYDEMVGLA